MKAEAATDVTTTAETAVAKEEAQADSEANAIQVATEEVPEAEVSVREKRVVSEATEVLQEENRVLFKEKNERQDVLKAMTDRPDAHLKRLKTEDREEASSETQELNFKNK